jgi:preprotein translocase subunit SecY
MTSELGRRVGFTLGALLVFRIGSYIPLPGIDLDVWAQVFRSNNSLLGTIDLSSGGAVGRLSIFSLGITPYVSAAVAIQVFGLFFRRFRLLRNSGHHGRKRIEAYTRALTLVLALLQGYGIASALSGVSDLVANPGTLFTLAVTLTLAASAMFLIWLAEQIALRGIGNGIALFLCAGIVISLPQAIVEAFELQRRGLTTDNQIAGVALVAVLLVAFAVFVERAQRQIPVAYGLREDSRVTSYLALKLNSAGVVPALLASLVLTLPLILWTIFGFDPSSGENLRLALQHGQPLYMVCFAVLVFLCVYLYAALVLDPEQAAENLQRYGGAIPQVEPGEPTAAHIDGVMSRVTLIGAVYFVLICLIPELLLYRFDLPFYVGGTSLLILVCTVVDIEKQVRACQAHQTGG